MEEIITKEKAQKLMEIEGETRGMAIIDDFGYLFQKKGKEGIKKLEDELEKLGYPIKYKEIKAMKFYPSGLEAVIMLSTKKLFDYNKEDFKELGLFSSRVPLVIRLFVKYFGSLETIAKESPKMWRRHYTKGDLKIAELNKDKKYIIIRLENFTLHPIYCIGLEGYFIGIIKMIIKGPVTCEETKCTFRGDDYHEFLLKW